MRMLFWIASGFLASVLSVNVAVARVWNRTQESAVAVVPGAVSASLLPPCARSDSEAGGDRSDGEGRVDAEDPNGNKKKKAKKVTAKPCKPEGCTGFGCKSGQTCSGKCTDEDGTQGKCHGTKSVQTNPLWIGCPGFRWISCSCESDCPIGAGSFVTGGLLGALLMLARRLRSNFARAVGA